MQINGRGVPYVLKQPGNEFSNMHIKTSLHYLLTFWVSLT